MERLNKEEMELLLSQGKKEPCISIYMPTKKGRERAKENSTRFKNLLAKAEEQLESWSLEPAEKSNLLDSAKKLISDSYYWANQSEGLAYFIADGFSQYYRLPVQFEEMSVVRKTFHIKPLFTLLSSDGQFYILALSQKDARLMRGTQTTVEEMDLSKLIEKFEVEFVDEIPAQFLQFHTGAPESAGTRTAIYFGHGGEIDSLMRERLLNYFRFIDREIQGLLDGNNSPLILACVDYLTPLYKTSSKYPLLFEDNIKGNPENLSAGELHQKAWEIVKPYFQEKQETAKKRYHELKGTGKTSNDILEILPAAYHGRISELFVTPGVQQWGRYDPAKEEISLNENPQDGSGGEDLIDMAVAKTFLSNGTVYAVDSGQMPDTAPVAAVYRW